MIHATRFVAGVALKNIGAGLVTVTLTQVEGGSRARAAARFMVDVQHASMGEGERVRFIDARGYPEALQLGQVVQWLSKHMSGGAVSVRINVTDATRLPAPWTPSRINAIEEKFAAVDPAALRDDAAAKVATVTDWAESGRRAAVLDAAARMGECAAFVEWVRGERAEWPGAGDDVIEPPPPPPPPPPSEPPPPPQEVQWVVPLDSLAEAGEIQSGDGQASMAGAELNQDGALVPLAGVRAVMSVQMAGDYVDSTNGFDVGLSGLLDAPAQDEAVRMEWAGVVVVLATDGGGGSALSVGGAAVWSGASGQLWLSVKKGAAGAWGLEVDGDGWVAQPGGPSGAPVGLPVLTVEWSAVTVDAVQVRALVTVE